MKKRPEIAEEAEAERVYQASKAPAVPAPTPGHPTRGPGPHARPAPTVGPSLQSLVSGDNPMGPQVLRSAPTADPGVMNYYVQDGGISRWLEIPAGMTREETARAILAK